MSTPHYFLNIIVVGNFTYVSQYFSPCQNAGCLGFPCEGASPEDENAIVTKAFRTILELDLWNEFPFSLGGTNAPTPSPTKCQYCTDAPTLSPVNQTFTPTAMPVVIPTAIPSQSPSRELDVRFERFREIELFLKQRRGLIESKIFVSETLAGITPSTLYTLDGFLDTLREVSTTGIEGLVFFLGQQGSGNNLSHGLVNIALFLAHAMTRGKFNRMAFSLTSFSYLPAITPFLLIGILWDTCEEVNHRLVNGKLPLSNACGQYSQSYGDELCPMTDVPMKCSVDPNMNVSQTSVGNSGSPPFFCAPTSTTPFTGYYDPLSDETMSNVVYSNSIGRTDVEGERMILSASDFC